MSKILVLAEKPSVGRDIARVLKCTKKGNGYIEGNNYIVTWALGHLVTLAAPEAYDGKYKSWRIEDLPMLPEKLKLIVIKQTGKQYNAVKSQMLRKDVNQIVIATDAGREGELVARWIIEKANARKPIKRLWISSVTDKAIKEGFNKLKDGRNYNNLYYSAVARAEADWLVGLNATRALTCKFNAQLSCGRVQTPTLAMINSREEEINKFKPKDFYGVVVYSKSLKFTWRNNNNESRIFDKKKAEKIANNIEGKNIIIKDVKVSKKQKRPLGLYDLTELQRDANRLFGFSAKETLSTMQKLYEQHKVLTYPRTDSKYISNDIVPTLKDRIKACGVGEYAKPSKKLLTTGFKTNKSFVNDAKVSDHHAIIPTEEYVDLRSLNDKERKIYDLVVKRFLSVLFPAMEYEETVITGDVAGEKIVAKGKKIINLGWKEVYSGFEEEDDDKEDVIQSIPNKGDKLLIDTTDQTEGKTTPPKRFTEGTLLQAMENPVKYMDNRDEKLTKTLGQTGGIGTVATRADIIEKLYKSFLIEKKDKYVYITSKGKQLLNLVPTDMKSPELTAKWEQKLKDISDGKLAKDKFISDIVIYTKDVVNEIKSSSEKFKHTNVAGDRCPECGKFLLEVNTKQGKSYVCQDRECGYRKLKEKITNARCPECRKKLKLSGQGESAIFTCVCGYREKMSSFNKRKNNKNTTSSKKEVNKYLKKQKKENAEPFNSAFAEAFAKFNK